MTKTRIILLLTIFSMLTGLSMAKYGDPTPEIVPLVPPEPTMEEGFFLDGVEGLLIKDSSADTWSFVPDERIRAVTGVTIPAGKPLSVLPCSVLEQMTGLAGTENKLRIRYWALFTKLNEANYLYSVYFMPMETVVSEPAKTTPVEEKTTQEQQKDSIIPSDILNQIRSNKTPDLKKFQKIAMVSGDVNLIGRSGYLVIKDGKQVFQPDALGMKINSREFILLPNKMLGEATDLELLTPGKQRYTISGLVTEYKGKTYMLLRRAVRSYTHGNFLD